MPTRKTNKAWKSRERQVAGFFGCLRNRLSGSSGREDVTTSDTTHEHLYIECKMRQKHFAQELYEDCKAKCKGTDKGKTPVVALITNGKPGFLVCIHSSDIKKFAHLYLAEEWGTDCYDKEEGNP